VLLKLVLIAFFLAGLVFGQVMNTRTVERTAVISQHDPKVRIELPEAAQYIGADRWILYGMDDCELHAFIEADQHRHVRKLYWVQFEAYLPSKPSVKHRYHSPRHANLGGLDFYVDTWVWSRAEKTRPGSDVEHLRSLLRSHGYRLPDGMMQVRLVHLMDGKRKELMIIYGEDLAGTGWNAEDLQKGGRAHDHWASLQNGVIQRAEQQIRLENTAQP
jgi:hypothetical protein